MNITERLYDIFTKSRWELSFADISIGVAFIFGALITFACIGFLIAWLCGKFDKKKQEQEKDKGDRTDVWNGD